MFMEILRMYKKVILFCVSVMLLIACSSKDKSIDLSEDLNLEHKTIDYDPTKIRTVRTLDIIEDELYYLSVDQNGGQIVIHQDFQGNETIILEENEETIETFTKINNEYYYVTFLLSDNFEDATYNLYKYDETGKILLTSGYGEVSNTFQLFKLKEKLYTLLYGVESMNDQRMDETSIYLYNVTDDEIVYTYDQKGDEILTISNHLNGSVKDRILFSIIQEEGHNIKTDVISFDGHKIESKRNDNLAISQVSEFEGGEIFTYSVMSGEAMIKKIAVTKDDELIKTNLELSFFEHVTPVNEGIIIYGQLGEHESKITYYYLTLDDRDVMHAKQVSNFEFVFGRKLPSAYVNTDDSEYASGKMKLTYITY